MVRLSMALTLAVVTSMLSAPATAQTRGVVELFTSQGCSSCPEADRLAGELAKDPSLVVMSLPIDYWDYLGWKDTLAKPRHTARQRGYAKMRSDREVYTPQVVINGKVHVVGSDKGAIERAIAETHARSGVLSVAVKVSTTDGKLTVSVPAASGPAATGEVWLCVISKSVPVTIARGENHGKTIVYHNVVRRWAKLGDWTGAARTFTVPAVDYSAEAADTVAVVLQGGTVDNPGTMLGAAVAALH